MKALVSVWKGSARPDPVTLSSGRFTEAVSVETKVGYAKEGALLRMYGSVSFLLPVGGCYHKSFHDKDAAINSGKWT